MNINALRLSVVGVASAGLVAAAAFTPLGSAVAGHDDDENTLLVAHLDGDQEVDDGDSDGRGLAFVFATNHNRRLCFVLTVEKIGEPTAAHIHEGEEDENGPVVVTLVTPKDSSADCLRARGREARKLVRDIIENPEEYYVNVHNERYPAGAIRGQLEVQD